MVGIFLGPGDRAPRADDPHSQAVVVADRHLRGPVQPTRLALVVDEDRGIVVERTPGTSVSRRAHSLLIRRPVSVRTMFSTWVPMSPTQSAFPVSFGSARQAACLCTPSRSSGVASHSCAYSAFTKRSSPRSPRAIISRACFTAGYPVYVYVTQNNRSFPRASAASSSASATSSVSGLSQATWMPRERNALAAAKCEPLGVTITAK